jgi:hypothetical protein
MSLIQLVDAFEKRFLNPQSTAAKNSHTHSNQSSIFVSAKKYSTDCKPNDIVENSSLLIALTLKFSLFSEIISQINFFDE